ncbi:MAG TPA: MraY family glycosyltransferase [Nitrospira sp.]|nr:MraY family glycosyltransferase [Nitrospira sp.]
MTRDLFFSFMTSLLVCMALIPPLRIVAERWRIIDLPGERKVHEHPVPRIGGIAFALAAYGSILWWAPKDRITLSVLFGSLIILAFGVWDDRAQLGYRTKLTGQVIAALATIVFGEVRFESVPFVSDASIPSWLGIPLTLIFLIAVSNAVNLADGLDGLAGGLSFLTFSGIAYLAYLSHDSAVLILTAPFLGAVLGFLRYNTYPARIFMGDGGSQLLGFMMGVLAILLSDSTRGPFSSSLALFLLGLPFLDTLGVVGQRLAEGRPLFVGDRIHTHHKLLTIGLSHYEAVTVIYAVQAGMIGLAYLLRWQSDLVIASLYLLISACVLAGFVAAGRGMIAVPRDRNGHFFPTPTISKFLSGPWLTDMPIRFLAIAVPGFLVATVLFPTEVPEDVGYLSIGLFAVVLLGLALLPRFVPYFVRGGLYVGTTCLLYVTDNLWSRSFSGFAVTNNAFFIIVAVMVLLSLRFNEQSRFQTTPLDYLMVFLAVTFPLLPEVSVDVSTLSLFAAKLIVLFFSFELLLHAFSNHVRQLGLVSLWVLFGLGIRIWL